MQQTTQRHAGILFVLACLTGLPLLWPGTQAAASSANAPPLPSTFYGAVTIDGAPPAASVQVTAWISDVLYAAVTTTMEDGEAVYQMNVPGDDPDTPGVEGGRNGETIIFRINNVAVSPVAIWNSGALTALDLTAHSTFQALLQAEPPGGTEVTINDLITYTVTLSNTGPGILTTVVVSGAVPAGAQYVPDSAHPVPAAVQVGSFSGAPEVETILWQVDEIAAEGHFQGQFTVRIVQAPPNNLVTLRVFAQSDQTGAVALDPALTHIFVVPTALDEGDEPLAQRTLYLPVVFFVPRDH